MKVLRPLALHLSALALGPLWFILLVTGWATGLGMLITLVGLPVIWLTLATARAIAVLEAGLARDLLGADVAAPPAHPGWSLRARATDPRIWRAQLYLLARFALGVPIAMALVGVWAGAVGLIAAPAWYWALPDGIELGIYDVDTLWKAVLTMPLGAALAAVAVVATVLSGRAWKPIAERLLAARAPKPHPGAEWPEPGGEARALPPVMPPLRWTAAVAGGLELVCLFLWAVTGRTSAWPAWTALGLLVPVGVQAAFAARDHAPAPRLRGLTAHAGLALVAMVVCLGAWVISGAGSFWPGWVLLGLVISLGVHAIGEFGARSERRALAPRMEQLAKTRAGVVDARDDELRRIERDLHDGAQARLVAVAMNLGLAEERLDRDPHGARELVAEAQVQARTAIRELRDLARGIAPPVLADRGLQAAVEALAVTSPLPVDVVGDVGARPPAPVERAAYFVTAEALANAAKHSYATRVTVRLQRTPDRLVVEIADNGRGGARRSGSGLEGLRHRVEAVDGRLDVEEAAGAGTIIRASLPCGSS